MVVIPGYLRLHRPGVIEGPQGERVKAGYYGRKNRHKRTGDRSESRCLRPQSSEEVCGKGVDLRRQKRAGRRGVEIRL